jgi:hypothetical protein
MPTFDRLNGNVRHLQLFCRSKLALNLGPASMAREFYKKPVRYCRFGNPPQSGPAEKTSIDLSYNSV